MTARACILSSLLAASAVAIGTARAQGPAPAASAPSLPASAREEEWIEMNARLERAYRGGAFAQGLELATRALALAEASFGPDHPHTLVSVNNLGTLYNAMGRYSEAEPLYIRALAMRERSLGREHPDTLLSVGNLGFLYNAEGRYAEAEPLLLRALRARERTLGRDHPDTLLSVSNLGFLYGAQGRYSEAEPLDLRALETRERILGRDHPDTLLSVNNLAALYKAEGRYAAAEPLYVRALEAHERMLGRDHPDTLASVNNLAVLYNVQGRYADAEPLYVRALVARERTLGRDHPDTLLSVNNLAGLYVAQQRFAEAEPLLIRALQAREHILGTGHPGTLASVNSLAALYANQGRYAEAEPLYTRALRASEGTLGRSHPDTISAAVGLALVRLSSAEPATALDPARLAVSAIRARRVVDAPDVFAEAQQGREEIQDVDRMSLLADAAWAAAAHAGPDRTSFTAESFVALQDTTAGTTSRAVVRTAVRRMANETGADIGALVRDRDALIDQWTADNARYGAALAAADEGAEARRELLRTERAGIEARMGAIDATLRHDFPQYFSMVRPEALDLATTQAMLAPDEAILIVVPTSFGTHVMAIDRAGIDWVRSPWTRTEVDGAVGQLLGNIRVALAGGRFTYDRQTAYALYRQAVEPVANRLAGKRHVFVTTSGSLTSIPFGILVTDLPQGANDDPRALRATHWFADAHALIAIPSIQSLQLLRRHGRPAAAQAAAGSGFVGFGDPVLEGPPGHPEMCGHNGAPTSVPSSTSGQSIRTGAMLASVSLLRSLCPLPYTATELESMRAAFHAPQAAVFARARATERIFRSMDLSHARILALATHGLVAGDLSGSSEPGLVFTPPAVATDEDDGYVTASEVSALRLDADWVILSACNSAAGDGSAGAPGLSGLARAFFYAGARNLLVSHWPVTDHAGALLTVRTIQLMQEHSGYSRAEAVQRSMREVRNDPAHPAWSHPAVWAPFSLVGDGAH